jgi:hypothetical protein
MHDFNLISLIGRITERMYNKFPLFGQKLRISLDQEKRSTRKQFHNNTTTYNNSDFLKKKHMTIVPSEDQHMLHPHP